jgi:hypothetical protein
MDMAVSLRLERQVDDGEPTAAATHKTDHGVVLFLTP